MSRSSAEYVREEPSAQPFDLVGVVAGVLFAVVGLAYLFGGHKALSGSSSLVFPTLLVLLGLAGVAGSGLVRRSWFRPARQPAAAAAEDVGPTPAEPTTHEPNPYEPGPDQPTAADDAPPPAPEV